MKKYKLIKEYPGSPPIGATTDGFTDLQNINYKIRHDNIICDKIRRDHIENHPEFWQEVKDVKPIYITHDGVKCFHQDRKVWVIEMNWEEPRLEYVRYLPISFRTAFANKDNAYKFWEDNKPRFSKKDIKQIIFISGLDDLLECHKVIHDNFYRHLQL